MTVLQDQQPSLISKCKSQEINVLIMVQTLGDTFRVESMIIEEIPELQPTTITECKIFLYIYPFCWNEVAGTDHGCPS